MSTVKAERYAAYKDSGVEWLCVVPAHWNEVRIKDLAFLERGKFSHRPRNDPQMYDGSHPFIQTGDVARANKYVTTYKQTLSDKGTEVSRKFKSGTLLMAIAANIGDVAIVNFDTYFPDSVVGFTPTKSNTDYLFYLFTATRNELDRVKVTSTQDNLNLERLNSLVKFAPPFPEQIAIAAYLDIKTGQIDRQIDLLGQKAAHYGRLKQSLINETVTHGLNKSVSMKDSGVEWIGEMPVHWDMKRLKDLFTERSQKGYSDEPLLIASQTLGVTLKSLYSRNTMTVQDDFHLMKLVKINDFVISLRSFEGGIEMATHRGIISAAYTILFSQNTVDARFYKYLFKSTIFISILVTCTTGIREGRNVNYQQLKKELLVLPPRQEQTAIATYLDEKTVRIDRIVTSINDQIEKMKEMRKSLISDVVTGKIKVVS